jgi:SAM-dependent methyltransferase
MERRGTGAVTPGEIVRRGYDEVAERYREWTAGSAVRNRWLGELEARLRPSARILELGCGAGTPVAQRLSDTGIHVLGIDSSPAQIALARAAVPRAEFRAADMTQLQFADGSFDAVLAFYSITHVPRDLHAGLFESIRRWLKPGGIFVASLGTRDCAGWTGEWLGTTMYFSHFDAATNLDLLQQAGFLIERQEVIPEDEDGELVDFLWVVAAKPGDSPAPAPSGTRQAPD